MSIEANVVASHHFFAGEKKTLRFAIYQSDDVTPLDNAGFAMEWVLRRKETGAVVLTKTTGAGEITVSGVFNVNPSVNTQRTLVAIVDDDTIDLPSGVYLHTLWRTDAGLEGVLSFGDFQVRRAAAR